MRCMQVVALLFVATVLLVVTAAPASAQQGGFSAGAPGIGDPYFPLEGNGGYDVGHYNLSV